MTIARVLTGRSAAAIITATPAMSVQQGIDLLAKNRIGAAPVMEGGKVIGVFSERDVMYCLAHEGAAALDRRISEVMSAPAITVATATPVLDALSLITLRRIRHLPVVEGDEMVGLVSIGDLVKFRLEAVEREAEAMRTYIQAT
jgi:CBS domain-containing protein